MKIFKLLYLKYSLSLSICLFSSFVIFFIFSLLSNLNEEYKFHKIIDLSFLNTLQILVYVPSFIYILSVILFVVLLKANNEMIIIKSYFSVKKFLIFLIPIVTVFTSLEIGKKDLSQYLEDKKINIFEIDNESKSKIIIDNNGVHKTFTIIRNFDLNDISDTEYRFYSISNNKINFAEFSNDLVYKNNKIILNSYTQFRDEVIKEFSNKKFINTNYLNFTPQSSLVKYISKKDKLSIDFNFINLIFFIIFFLYYVFLYFFNSKFVSLKQKLFTPIITCLIILMYTFLIFNNSINSYKQEFEFLASLVMGLFLFKVFLNE